MPAVRLRVECLNFEKVRHSNIFWLSIKEKSVHFLRNLFISSKVATALKASCISSLIALSVPTNAGFDFDIGVANEYVRNGISQSRDDGIIESGFNFNHRSGFYTGVWASTVNQKGNSLRYEADAYAGFYIPLGYSFALDFGAMRYTFQGDADKKDLAYTDGYLSLLLNDSTSLAVFQSENFMDTNEPLRRIELAHTITNGDFSFEFMLGQSRFLKNNQVNSNFGGNRDDYFHFRTGVMRDFKNFSYGLTLERTNLGHQYSGGTKFTFSINRKFNFF